MAEIVVRALTRGLIDDWLAFFDRDAFADNPDWSGCYCQWFHVDHSTGEWETRTPETNRAASIDLIRAGVLNGYLAYVGGNPAGWCQAAPKPSIPNIANDPYLTGDDAGSVGSIVCFVVAAAYRRHGIARRLLEAVCAGFAAQGLLIAEAYPRREAAGDAANYHGPLGLYLRAGFEPYRELDDLVVVRCKLSA